MKFTLLKDERLIGFEKCFKSMKTNYEIYEKMFHIASNLVLNLYLYKLYISVETFIKHALNPSF